jgi:uncharacterized Zn ribbon protein
LAESWLQIQSCEIRQTCGETNDEKHPDCYGSLLATMSGALARDVKVKGYTKKDGTQVKGYVKTSRSFVDQCVAN